MSCKLRAAFLLVVVIIVFRERSTRGFGGGVMLPPSKYDFCDPRLALFDDITKDGTRTMPSKAESGSRVGR